MLLWGHYILWSPVTGLFEIKVKCLKDRNPGSQFDYDAVSYTHLDVYKRQAPHQLFS